MIRNRNSWGLRLHNTCAIGCAKKTTENVYKDIVMLTDFLQVVFKFTILIYTIPLSDFDVRSSSHSPLVCNQAVCNPALELLLFRDTYPVLRWYQFIVCLRIMNKKVNHTSTWDRKTIKGHVNSIISNTMSVSYRKQVCTLHDTTILWPLLINLD